MVSGVTTASTSFLPCLKCLGLPAVDAPAPAADFTWHFSTWLRRQRIMSPALFGVIHLNTNHFDEKSKHPTRYSASPPLLLFDNPILSSFGAWPNYKIEAGPPLSFPRVRSRIAATRERCGE